MSMDFNLLTNAISNLEENKTPRWGKMNSYEMTNHCNNFIAVSLGNQKIGFRTKLFGRLFGKLYLEYLKSINFDIERYPKNAKTLKELKNGDSDLTFIDQKNKLIRNISIVKDINTPLIKHNIYGRIKTSLFKKLVYFHTSYHLNQFGIL